MKPKEFTIFPELSEFCSFFSDHRFVERYVGGGFGLPLKVLEIIGASFELRRPIIWCIIAWTLTSFFRSNHEFSYFAINSFVFLDEGVRLFRVRL